MHSAKAINKNSFKKRFIVVQPFDGLQVKMASVTEALKNLQITDYLHILPYHYADPSFLASVKDKERYTAVLISVFKKKELEYVLDNFPNIEWVQGIGTGVDQMLSLPKIQNSGIKVTNLRSISADLLSEFALMGSLYFAKQVPEFLNLSSKGLWPSNNIYNVQSLYGKKALVVGLGTIGTKIAAKCKFGFGMNVTAIKNDLLNIPEYKRGFVDKFLSLDNLVPAVQEADFIYVSLPKIIGRPIVFNAAVFSNIKKGAVFVNVGRGSYVDEEALIAALKSGRLAGAALDVVVQEPLPSNSPFYTDDDLKRRVLITCHCADEGALSFENITRLVAENVKNYLNDRELVNVIDKRLGY